MLNLPDLEAQLAALQEPLPEALAALLAGRVKDSTDLELGDLTHIAVITKADSEEAIEEALGFSPWMSRIDGVRDHPDWDWLEQHEGWIELVYTVADSGFAFILLVADDGGNLAKLCRRHMKTL